MPDMKFPLSFDGNGSASVIDNDSLSINKVRHYLNTVKGERFLTPNFGIDVELLFETKLSIISEENIRIDLQSLSNEEATVITERKKRKIIVTIGNTNIEESF